jgi:hypothetical protein
VETKYLTSNLFEISNSNILIYNLLRFYSYLKNKNGSLAFSLCSAGADLSQVRGARGARGTGAAAENGSMRAKENNKEYFNQMIIGLILGDGTLVKKYEKGNTYFQYAQSQIHMAYIHHVFNIFVNSNYCNITKLDVKEIIVKRNMYKYLSFSTKSLQ